MTSRSKAEERAVRVYRVTYEKVRQFASAVLTVCTRVCVSGSKINAVARVLSKIQIKGLSKRDWWYQVPYHSRFVIAQQAKREMDITFTNREWM